MIGSWSSIIPHILSRPAHQDIEISADEIVEPETENISETIGEPQGQLNDYGITLEDGRRIHIRRFETVYRIHWDLVSPTVNAIEHLRRDAPLWYDVATSGVGAGLGALIGAAASGEKGATAGAAIGGVIGAFLGLLTSKKES